MTSNGYDLFQKILATPGDDALRLILIDWLDENDHHDLANIFRAATNERSFQLRLARLPAAQAIFSALVISAYVNA